jgi:hypothetical protein
MQVIGQFHALAALHPGRGPGTHRIGGWVGPRAGLFAVVGKKNSQPLPRLEPTIIQPVAQRYKGNEVRKIVKKSVQKQVCVCVCVYVCV